MVRKLLLLISLALGVVFATAPLASAQGEVDVEAVTESVLAADPQALLTGLETPMADENLPPGFSGAEFADPEEAGAEEGVVPAEDLEGTLGSVAYVLSYDPSGAATPAAGEAGVAGAATPEVDPGALSFAFGSLNYVVFEDELTSTDLEDFKAGAEEALAQATPAVGDATNEIATVSDVTVNDTEAVRFTYVNDAGGLQMIAIPVGNTLVLSIVAVAGPEVDADALQTDAEALLLSGVEHLGMVAESA